jgi:hypothetical protein
MSTSTPAPETGSTEAGAGDPTQGRIAGQISRGSEGNLGMSMQLWTLATLLALYWVGLRWIAR